jgi:hypothetical protein
MSIVPNILIDDTVLYKNAAANKVGDLITTINHQPLIKTAVVGNDNLINLFTKMLSALNITAKEENIKEIVGKITEQDLTKQASINKNSQERRDDIKIVSKSIKDSHYQIDISKDIIQREGKKMIMVSCYARDAYLGRYLIKRNYFYTEDRNKFADNAYDEILTKMSDIKDRYYNEVIDVNGIFQQIKQSLDGVISELAIKEDSLGATVNR